MPVSYTHLDVYKRQLYGRVDYLIICEDASCEVQGLSCSSRVRLSVLLEHAFVSGAMIVNMVSRSLQFYPTQFEKKGE